MCLLNITTAAKATIFRLFFKMLGNVLGYSYCNIVSYLIQQIGFLYDGRIAKNQMEEFDRAGSNIKI